MHVYNRHECGLRYCCQICCYCFLLPPTVWCGAGTYWDKAGGCLRGTWVAGNLKGQAQYDQPHYHFEGQFAKGLPAGKGQLTQQCSLNHQAIWLCGDAQAKAGFKHTKLLLAQHISARTCYCASVSVDAKADCSQLFCLKLEPHGDVVTCVCRSLQLQHVE